MLQVDTETDGSNSVFNTITSIGGGGGGLGTAQGNTGGSGGGSGRNYTSAGGQGTAGQGNNGGAGGTLGLVVQVLVEVVVAPVAQGTMVYHQIMVVMVEVD